MHASTSHSANPAANPPARRLEAQARITTPLGALTLAATAHGLALAWFDQQAHRTDTVDAPLAPSHPHLQQAAAEFEAYFARGSRVFTVALDPAGTPFQHSVWRALRAIAPGQLSSYGAIARQLGRPDAARAVGAAVGRNPIGIIVPCHRVVGSSGALTGYAAGLPRKQALLVLEGALQGTPAKPAGSAGDGCSASLFEPLTLRVGAPA